MKEEIKPEEFFRLLARESKDLENVVERIKSQTRLLDMKEESVNNLFATYPDGKRKFFIPDHNNWRINLLDKFPSLKELGGYVENLEEDWNPRVLDEKTRMVIPSEYFGPKIRLFKDSNVLIDQKARKYLNCLQSEPSIVQEVLEVIEHESKKGGLRRQFGNRVPKDISRGQVSLEKRCQDLLPSVQKEITIIYDIFHSLFKKEVDDIMIYHDKQRIKDPFTVAKKFVDQKRRHFSFGYCKTVSKIIERCLEGDKINFIADRVLTAASFGFNFVENYDRAIAVSNDSDILNMFDFFYQEVLPAYMARSVMDAMRKKDPSYRNIERCYKKTVNASRKQIQWARDTFREDPLALGILYVPRENRVYVKEVAMPLKRFFQKVELFRIGKIDLISKMVKETKSPNQAVEELMRGEDEDLMNGSYSGQVKEVQYEK